LAELVEAAFWAGLRFNEGRTTRVRIAVATPEKSYGAVVKLKAPVPYAESQIAALAPAVPASGGLVVSASSAGLTIWGFSRNWPVSPVDGITVELSEPGTVRIGVGPFRAFAVLNGRSDLVITASTSTHLAWYLQRILRKSFEAEDILEQQAVWRECLALVDLARVISADGHGGAVLIVPDETGTWEGTLDPFPYRFAPPDTTIRDVIRQELKDASAQGEAYQRLSDAAFPEELKSLAMSLPLAPTWGGMAAGIRAAASLAGVDGATVVTRDLRVLGFGAKIAVKDQVAPAIRKFQAPPGSGGMVVPLEDLGGTRHQSAARFAAANPDAAVVVISQDRHISVMNWDVSISSVAVLRNAEWLT
jgi:hypothetical protein